MPELPEVETVRRALSKNIVGLKIVDVKIKLPKIIRTDDFENKVIGRTFVEIKRQGKWLILVLDEGVLLSHLRMEGKYYYKKSTDEILKHEHVIIYLNNNMTLRYVDTRQFGLIHWFDNEDNVNLYLQDRLGAEPWDIKVTDLYKKIHHRTIPIKNILLDQKLISGIGNIYADEILFLAKISPLRPTNKVTKDELSKIVNNASLVLQKSIDLGGTTIRNFESELGQTGHYQNELLVHTKEGQPCPGCQGLVLKIKISGRGTYYCPNCQK